MLCRAVGAPQKRRGVRQTADLGRAIRTAWRWMTTYYTQDASLNVRMLTDSSGTVTDTWDYDAFGTVVKSLVDNIFRPTLGILTIRVNFAARFISLDGIEYPSHSADRRWITSSRAKVDPRAPSCVPADFEAACNVQS